MPCHDAAEGLPRHELHYLCEQRLAHVHAGLRVVRTRKHRKQAGCDSNRGHLFLRGYPCQNRGCKPALPNEPDSIDKTYSSTRFSVRISELLPIYTPVMTNRSSS